MTEKNDYRGLLGLAQRAGKIRSGEFQVEESVKKKKSKLCLLAEDASETAKKHLRDACRYRDIKCMEISLSKIELGHSIGKDERSAVSVEDEGFAKHILGIIEGGNACGK